MRIKSLVITASITLFFLVMPHTVAAQAGIQLNLKERLPATESKEQKFGSSVTGDRSCYPHDPSRFNKFLERTVNDFTGAMTEFQQTAASLKQAGKIQQEATGGATSSQSELSTDGVYQAMLSSIILDMGMPQRASEKAKEALRLLANHPEDFKFFWATALANYVLSNYDVAIANSNKALQLDPEDSGVYMCRGKSYFFKKDYQLALADFDKVIELAPKFPTAHLYRGLTHYSKNDYDRAIADFDKAIELNSKATTAYIFRGSAYSQKGDHNRAIAEYSEVIRMEPDNVPAYELRAKAYEKIGDKVKAQADRDKAAELEKQSAKP